jgi:hypothetical protein
MGFAMTRDSDRQDESRRIIDRVSREAGSDASSFLRRSARRARNHMAAEDADHDDWAELWGTRIGRVLGGVITVLLLCWLVSYLFRG